MGATVLVWHVERAAEAGFHVQSIAVEEVACPEAVWVEVEAEAFPVVPLLPVVS